MSANTLEPGRSGFDNEFLEKGTFPTRYVASADDRYCFEQSDLDRVQRRLKQRHVQMCVIFCSFMGHRLDS
jgi:amino acid transporter